ncbi:GNAT family N-acetyltransferase [Streptomyces griseocarneus]|uniref:GNAT family N-acetyltransferase n=1 Tax=Streptomyces griseocarneus TaxID=51201 RepID=UPI00167C4F3B|nr:GNAT family N-acetyltransferase [Streptomyces griseocarneus]MBZ6473702.1 GNAT family N-acetyltransferase [Streptomyces griseocarneus]GHG64629.1 phosphinothricin N-acetyltransferase [Streptomyces griseocarneus]
MRDSTTATRVRPGTYDDLVALTGIYNHYVAHTPITFDIAPVGLEARRAWLDAHPATGRHRLLVAEEAGTVLGYATSGPFRDKQAYETSVETSVYLAPEHTGRGLGGLLYDALFEALATEDVHRAYAGITQPNAASMRLHERFGFRPAGVLEQVGRKFGTFWDVAWLEKRLR